MRPVSILTALCLVVAACGGTDVDSGASSEAPTPRVVESSRDVGAGEATARPSGFPAEFPLPDGGFHWEEMSGYEGTFSSLLTSPDGIVHVFVWDVPVDALVRVVEEGLEAQGWDVLDRVTGVAHPDDVALLAGHRETGRVVGVEIGPEPDDDEASHMAVLLAQ